MPAVPARHVAWAFLLAVFASGLAAALVSVSIAAFVVIGAVAFVAGGLFGVPIYLLLRWRGHVNAFTSVSGGVFAGAVPYAAAMYPNYEAYSKSSVWFNGVAYRVNGVATEAAWSSYYSGLATAAALGAFAGLCFWLYLRGHARSAT